MHWKSRNALLSRRRILRAGGALAAGKAVFAAPFEANGREKPLKVVCVGGHPDDPESACGGTMALYAAAGHNVVALYLTRGEAGISGKSAGEAAAIRSKEAENACKILGARALFAGQVDGNTEINRARYAEFQQLLAREDPDVVFTHWPIDTHPDHRAASLLTYNAWQVAARTGGKTFDLYYHEVLTGKQTQQFTPTVYMDITAVWQKKKDAIYAHASQNPDEFYPAHKEMEEFRGTECGCGRAEAFVAYARRPAKMRLP